MGHHFEKTHHVTRTATVDAEVVKQKEMQQQMPTVRWRNERAENCWHFVYLGSLMEAGGEQMPDVRRRIALATSRFGKLRHI